MREKGLEPIRYYYPKILSLVRLPITPLSHINTFFSTTLYASNGINWSEQHGSNVRPHRPKRCTLPLSYVRINQVLIQIIYKELKLLAESTEIESVSEERQSSILATKLTLHMVSGAGFEPTHAGVKVPCLTDLATPK